MNSEKENEKENVMDTGTRIEAVLFTRAKRHGGPIMVPACMMAWRCVDDWIGLDDASFASALLPDDALRDEFERLNDAEEEDPYVWDEFHDRVFAYAQRLPVERLVEWFVRLHDPVTISSVRYITREMEYLDPECTMDAD